MHKTTTTVPFLRILSVLILTAAAVGADAAVLTHRYPFNLNTKDSVGGADATTVGLVQSLQTEVRFVDGSGKLLFPTSLQFTNYESISLEFWCLPSAGSARTLFTFGDSAYTLSVASQGSRMTGQIGASIVVGPALEIDQLSHLVFTQDRDSQVGSLYCNGVLVGRNSSFTNWPGQMLATAQGWLGGGYVGRMREFRIYQGALTDLEVMQNNIAGADVYPPNPGSLQSVELQATPVAVGTQWKPRVLANFSNMPAVNIAGPSVALSSDTPAVISVRSDGYLEATGVGSARVTAVFQGRSDVRTVTVVTSGSLELAHRYSFDDGFSTAVVVDSVGGAHGSLVGSEITAHFSGSGELVLSNGWARLPNGILSSKEEVTIEAWAQQKYRYFNVCWPMLFNFGNYSIYTYSDGFTTTIGETYFCLTPYTSKTAHTGEKNLFRFTISTNRIDGETPRLDTTNLPPVAQPFQVTVAYSPNRGVARLYLNGRLVDSDTASIPLSSIVDTNNLLGYSQWAADAPFLGSLNELRIYKRLLSESEIAADYAAGPDMIGSDFVPRALLVGDQVEISWGPSAGDCVIETSSSCSPGAVWTEIREAPVFSNGRFRISSPALEAVAYFRLRKN